MGTFFILRTIEDLHTLNCVGLSRAGLTLKLVNLRLEARERVEYVGRPLRVLKGTFELEEEE